MTFAFKCGIIITEVIKLVKVIPTENGFEVRCDGITIETFNKQYEAEALKKQIEMLDDENFLEEIKKSIDSMG